MEEKGQNCGRGLWVATVDVDVIQLPESGLPTCLEPGVSVSRSALEHAVNAKSSAEMGKAAREAALAEQRLPSSAFIPVQEMTVLDPCGFAFCNPPRDGVKLLFFNRSGLMLVLKRMTDDKIAPP